MGGYRISELAERTGFPASTLRFYEQEGLLPAAPRTPGGYRSYDEHAVERLKFIARAKQLDLPLEEIRDLDAVWAAGSCVPVQERLAALLTGKISDVDTRIAELRDFRAQLAAARDGLSRHTPAGRCDDDCGCLSQPGSAVDVRPAEPAQLPASRPVTLPPIERSAAGAQPVACTLTGPDQQTRVQEWARLLGSVTGRDRVDGGTRLTLPADADLIGQVGRLAALEQQCCRFFGFTIELTADTATLTVRAPAHAADLLDTLFGQPDQPAKDA